MLFFGSFLKEVQFLLLFKRNPPFLGEKLETVEAGTNEV